MVRGAESWVSVTVPRFLQESRGCNPLVGLGGSDLYFPAPKRLDRSGSHDSHFPHHCQWTQWTAISTRSASRPEAIGQSRFTSTPTWSNCGCAVPSTTFSDLPSLGSQRPRHCAYIRSVAYLAHRMNQHLPPNVRAWPSSQPSFLQ